MGVLPPPCAGWEGCGFRYITKQKGNAMYKYIGKRILQMFLALFLISVFVFALLQMIPGDPVYAMLGDEISIERHDQVYREMRLDRPLPEQYAVWMKGFIGGDMGYSFSYRKPVAELVAARLPTTMYLGVLSSLVSVALGVLFGAATAVKRGTWVDNVVTVISNIGLATPIFWLGILLVLVFSLKLGWLPSNGFTFPWEDFGLSVQQTIMPVICMSIGGVASYTRQTRSSMLEVIRQDYIRTARSKGLPEGRVIWKHALKNALIPILTLIAVTLRNTIAGTAVVENVFNINGMGSLMVQCITKRDFQLVQACILLLSAVTCVCNLLVDIAYAYVDPRIRLK